MGDNFKSIRSLISFRRCRWGLLGQQLFIKMKCQISLSPTNLISGLIHFSFGHNALGQMQDGGTGGVGGWGCAF